jgi:hypothetical protein
MIPRPMFSTTVLTNSTCRIAATLAAARAACCLAAAEVGLVYRWDFNAERLKPHDPQ